MRMKFAILLNGPIGAGKTTLGKALAAGMDAGFIDGDDHHQPGKAWFASSLSTSASIVSASVAVLEDRSAVIIAYPLRCSTWVYFTRKFEAANVCPLFVGLRAGYGAITAAHRQRVFSNAERKRIVEMIRQGYGDRFFNVATIDSGTSEFAETLAQLCVEVRRQMTLKMDKKGYSAIKMQP
jgi:hypothetical protein